MLRIFPICEAFSKWVIRPFLTLHAVDFPIFFAFSGPRNLRPSASGWPLQLHATPMPQSHAPPYGRQSAFFIIPSFFLFFLRWGGRDVEDVKRNELQTALVNRRRQPVFLGFDGHATLRTDCVRVQRRRTVVKVASATLHYFAARVHWPFYIFTNLLQESVHIRVGRSATPVRALVSLSFTDDVDSSTSRRQWGFCSNFFAKGRHSVGIGAVAMGGPTRAEVDPSRLPPPTKASRKNGIYPSFSTTIDGGGCHRIAYLKNWWNFCRNLGKLKVVQIWEIMMKISGQILMKNFRRKRQIFEITLAEIWTKFRTNSEKIISGDQKKILEKFCKNSEKILCQINEYFIEIYRNSKKAL